VPRALTSRHQGYGRVLSLEPFWELLTALESYRLDPELAQTKQSERIHAFIRGLRLSARLIYIIRRVLSGTGMEVHWGQVLSEDGRVCSRECDVIIHRPGELARWNGDDEKPVMDFRFITREKAAAVISCKSFLRSVDKEQIRYREDMKRYVDRVYLFAGYCYRSSLSRLRQTAHTAGYDGLWHLCAIDRKTGVTEQDEHVWVSFIGEMEKIAAIAPGGSKS